jgi:hypothetical protein
MRSVIVRLLYFILTLYAKAGIYAADQVDIIAPSSKGKVISDYSIHRVGTEPMNRMFERWVTT